MRIGEITKAIEDYAPLWLQESYDNAGVQVGDLSAEVTGVLLCTDITEPVLDEAIAKGANLVISHHPLIFRPLKKIAGRSVVERIVAKAIKNDVTLYAAHTNMDNAYGGVNFKMAEKLGLQNVEVLDCQAGKLVKIVTFVPTAHVQAVETAMWQAGAGKLGDYDCCSYRMAGEGHYRALENANPFAGEVGVAHVEAETRVEVIADKAHSDTVVNAMLTTHPYEEPAYDILPMDNVLRRCGSGVVGDIEPQDAIAFLEKAKRAFGVEAVRYSGDTSRKVSRVAMCGGAGSFLIGKAMAKGADVFLTGDMKYHEFLGNEDRIIIADIGHYESEHYTKEIFLDIIRKKNPNFAINYAEKEKNQINYL